MLLRELYNEPGVYFQHILVIDLDFTVFVFFEMDSKVLSLVGGIRF